jgi:Uma2 family endonuclease
MSMTATIPAPVLSDYELERGKPMPDFNHSLIQRRLLLCFDRLYEARFTIMPELHVKLLKRERVPDLAVYPPLLSFHPRHNPLVMTKPPLCAIEILSEMQKLSDLMSKNDEYFDAGVLSYWLVLPHLQSIYVFNSADEYDVFTRKDILVDKILDVKLDLSKIFS